MCSAATLLRPLAGITLTLSAFVCACSGRSVTIPVHGGPALVYDCAAIQPHVESFDQIGALAVASATAQVDALDHDADATAASISAARQIHDWQTVERRTVEYLCAHDSTAHRVAANTT